MENKQNRYFECLEVCVEDEQGETCREICTPALTDDPDEHPKVELPQID